MLKTKKENKSQSLIGNVIHVERNNRMAFSRLSQSLIGNVIQVQTVLMQKRISVSIPHR